MIKMVQVYCPKHKMLMNGSRHFTKRGKRTDLIEIYKCGCIVTEDYIVKRKIRYFLKGSGREIVRIPEFKVGRWMLKTK